MLSLSQDIIAKLCKSRMNLLPCVWPKLVQSNKSRGSDEMVQGKDVMRIVSPQLHVRGFFNCFFFSNLCSVTLMRVDFKFS